MPRRKTNPHLIPGDIAQYERPEWRPLLEVVGDLSRWFMWMGELELAEGTSVHAYKHRSTRRYLHLGADGRAFAFVPPARSSQEASGAYRPISRVEAIDEAFYDWEKFFSGDTGFEEMAAELDHARVHAKQGEPMPFDPEWLARQRRFDLACEAALLHEREHRQRLDEVRFDDGSQFFGDMATIDDFETAEHAPQAAAA